MNVSKIVATNLVQTKSRIKTMSQLNKQLIVLLTLLLAIHLSSGEHVIYVNINGTNNSSCWYNGPLKPCKTLDIALQGASLFPSVSVLIQSGRYDLDPNISVITYLAKDTFILTGVGGWADIYCHTGTGIRFNNCHNTTINYIVFHNCGYTTDQHRNEYDSYTLFFIHCFTIVIENVVVKDSTGTGILVYHPVKSIYVKNTTFIRNNESGLIIISPVENEEYELGISINKLEFLYNHSTCIIPLYIEIYESVFINNTGFNGGGLGISLHDITVQIVIKRCIFSGNEAFNNGGGGYIRLVSRETLMGQFVFTGCLIYNNKAFKGGGLAVILTDTYLTHKYQQGSCFTFENCSLDSNKARGSAAIYSVLESTNTSPNSLYNNFINYLLFSNCSFKRNIIPRINNKPTIMSEYSTITTLRIPLQFINFNIFKYNNATALSIGSTSAILGGVIIFSHNIGMNGGAIAVHDNSYIIISEGLDATFDSNIAINKGPAIYFSNLVPQTGNCFIRYIDTSIHPNDWNCFLTFINNSHGYGLNGSIYISSLNTCIINNSLYSYTLLDILCSIKLMYNNSNCTEQIFTGPSYIQQTSKLIAILGVPTTVPIRIYDETDHNISYITPLVFLSNNNHFVQTEYSNHTYSSNPTTDHQMSYAPPKPNVTRMTPFLTIDDQIVDSVLLANISYCPPGFVFLKGICNCPHPIPFYLTCHRGFYFSNLAYLKIGWIMTHDKYHDNLHIAPIQLYRVVHRLDNDNLPISGYYALPGDRLQLNTFMCGSLNRTGVLCSQCVQNTSVAANVYDFPCVPCNGEQLWRNIL